MCANIERSLNLTGFPRGPKQLGEQLFTLFEIEDQLDIALEDDSDLIKNFPIISEFLSHYMNLLMFLMLLEGLEESGFQEKRFQDFGQFQQSRHFPEEIAKDQTLTI